MRFETRFHQLHRDSYCVYRGRTYLSRQGDKDTTVLVVAPGDEVPEGFTEDELGRFTKSVGRGEISHRFALSVGARFDGETFEAYELGDGRFQLTWQAWPERAKELGFAGSGETFGISATPASVDSLWQSRSDMLPLRAPEEPLSDDERVALLVRIGRMVRAYLPKGWERAELGFAQVGWQGEVSLRSTADDVTQSWSAPPMLSQLLTELRTGMYVTGKGAWTTAQYVLDASGGYEFAFAYDDEPRSRAMTDDHFGDYAAELTYFPRSDEHIPQWWRPFAGLPSTTTFRQARAVDEYVEGRQPVVNRPPVPPNEVPHLLHYLERCPIVVPGRGFDRDIFNPASEPNVPKSFMTDGTWIWHAAVAHFLRKYGTPPEADLLEHIRRNKFQVPFVPEIQQRTARAVLYREDAPAQAETDLPRLTALDRVEHGDLAALLRPADLLTVLHQRFDEYDVSREAYRIGASADGKWCLRQAKGVWEVARFDGEEPCDPVYFRELADAAQHLLGALLLHPARAAVGAVEHESGKELADWPIQPGPGDLSLSLLHGKRMVRLRAGSTVIRWGDDKGKLTYSLHPSTTEFPETSLPGDRQGDRRVYKLTRPLYVLTGTVQPAHGQPGGAVAYLLPKSIAEHLADAGLSGA